MKKSIMRSILIFSGLILTSMLTGIGIYSVLINNFKKDISSSTARSDNQAPIEFQVTKEEFAETSKWKNKSMTDLNLDALKGDRGALYMIGMSFLTGHWGAIDTESANNYFAQSASLGFTPAIHKIFTMYIEQEKYLLAIIYLNLIVSDGHREFLQSYFNFRSLILTDSTLGPKIAQEVERIAIRKKSQIQKNKDKLNNYSDKNKGMITFTMTNLGNEDLVYDDDYWVNVKKGIIPDDVNIYCLMIERSAERAEANDKHIDSYK